MVWGFLRGFFGLWIAVGFDGLRVYRKLILWSQKTAQIAFICAVFIYAVKYIGVYC
jgi:hypothetical protein